jgi:ATP adenylyltransferase
VERLWATWRMSYIESARSAESGCLFCRKPDEGDDRRALVLERQGSCYTLLNAFPYNSGHLMVAPLRHVGSFAGLSGAERGDLLSLVARAETALSREYRPHGFNMGVNLGEAAGAGVLGHLHVHLVPRWQGDTNFMTAVGETKVLPEGLDRTFERLKRALTAIEVD